MRWIWTSFVWCSIPLVPLAAAEIVAPVSQRFANPNLAEVPDFQRHVVPLLGRLGCNGRACHGSFQGQGGFRLSLFGYDFDADHAALTQGENPRVDRKASAKSLILQKPTLTIDHGGGERFAVGEWEYHLLKRWIEAGADGRKKDHAELGNLEAFAARDRVSKAGRDGRPENHRPVGATAAGGRHAALPVSNQ